MYRAMRAAYPVLRRVLPNIGVTSEELARAMVRVGLDGSLGGNDPAIEHREIRRLGAD